MNELLEILASHSQFNRIYKFGMRPSNPVRNERKRQRLQSLKHDAFRSIVTGKQ